MTATGSGSAATGDDPFTKALSSFKGGAATLRFTGDGLEFALAADGSAGQLSEVTGNDGGALVQRLPDDTAAAAGLTLPEGLDGPPARPDVQPLRSWHVPATTPRASSPARPVSTFRRTSRRSSARASRSRSARTSTSRPQRTATAVGAPDRRHGQGRPRGDRARARQDPGEGRQRPRVPGLGLVRRPRGDRPDGRLPPAPAGRRDLGDDDTFRGVVPDAGDASSVFYVNLDALEPAITKAAAGDRQTLDNITPTARDGDVDLERRRHGQVLVQGHHELIRAGGRISWGTSGCGRSRWPAATGTRASRGARRAARR